MIAGRSSARRSSALLALAAALASCGEPTPQATPRAEPPASRARTPPRVEPPPLCGVIAFVSERDGNPEVYTVDAGGETRRTRSDDAEFVARSRAGAVTIVRTRDMPGGTHREELALLPLDPAGVATPRPLADASGRVRNPSWSPDGRWLVFESDRASFRDLYRVDVTDDAGARTPQRLTDNPEGNFEPDVSPDGRRVAFVSSRDGDAELYLQELPADATTDATTGAPAAIRRTRRRGDDARPRWSPDGRQIAFTQTGGGHTRVYLLDPDREADAPRPLRPTPSERGEDQDHAWSPDSAHIALTATRPGYAEVMVFAVATGELVARSAGAGQRGVDQQPTWSPDGEHVAFASSRDGDTELYRLEIGTGTLTRITRSPGPDWLPRWLPGECAARG